MPDAEQARLQERRGLLQVSEEVPAHLEPRWERGRLREHPEKAVVPEKSLPLGPSSCCCCGDAAPSSEADEEEGRERVQDPPPPAAELQASGGSRERDEDRGAPHKGGMPAK